MSVVRRLAVALALFVALSRLLPATASAAEGLETTPPAQLPVEGVVTLVDLGSKTCIPCRMMAPILEELEAEYRGKAKIAFVDVAKHHDQVERFGLRAIPTQVFFDARGREVSRHVGFMGKEAIIAELKKLGVE